MKLHNIIEEISNITGISTQQIQKAGLIENKFRHISNKKTSYTVSLFRLKDSTLCANLFDWRDQSNTKIGLEGIEISRHDLEFIRKIQESANNDLLENQKKNAERAKDLYCALSDSGVSEHPYVKSKGIIPYNAKVNGENLVIPVYASGQITSLQTISASLVKRYMPGCSMNGAYHIIGNMGSTYLLTEGWANACYIHEKTGYPCIVAFDTGGIKKFHETIKEIPGLYIKNLVLIEDNDNPGAAACSELLGAMKGKSVNVLIHKLSGNEGNSDVLDLDGDERVKYLSELNKLVESIVPGQQEYAENNPFQDDEKIVNCNFPFKKYSNELIYLVKENFKSFPQAECECVAIAIVSAMVRAMACGQFSSNTQLQFMCGMEWRKTEFIWNTKNLIDSLGCDKIFYSKKEINAKDLGSNFDLAFSGMISFNHGGIKVKTSHFSEYRGELFDAIRNFNNYGIAIKKGNRKWIDEDVTLENCSITAITDIISTIARNTMDFTGRQGMVNSAKRPEYDHIFFSCLPPAMDKPFDDMGGLVMDIDGLKKHVSEICPNGFVAKPIKRDYVHIAHEVISAFEPSRTVEARIQSVIERLCNIAYIWEGEVSDEITARVRSYVEFCFASYLTPDTAQMDKDLLIESTIKTLVDKQNGKFCISDIIVDSRILRRLKSSGCKHYFDRLVDKGFIVSGKKTTNNRQVTYYCKNNP